MMERVFWIIATLVFAAVVHISYVLYAQRIEMKGFINQAAASVENAELSSNAALDALPEALTGESAAYMCSFDLANGAFQFKASMPDAMWVISIYTAGGENIFAINDQQAAVQSFTITVKKQRSLGEILSTNEDIGRAGEEWHVESADAKGLVVVWAAAGEAGKRPLIQDALNRSLCRNSPEA